MQQGMFSSGMAGQIEALKKKKRYDEKHIFEKMPLENIEFVVGAGKNVTAPIAASIFAMVTIYIGGGIIKDVYITEKKPDFIELIFPITLILCTALVCGALIVYSFTNAQFAVQGEEFFYRKKWYKASQIWEMRIAPMGQITVYVEGKKLVTYGLLDNNSEKLIAWARKAGVQIQDQRSDFDG